MKKTSRYEKARIILIVQTLFIGIGALVGSTAMLIDPSGKILGMNEMLPYFEKLPFAEVLFKDYVFSGISLLIVNGLTNLVAAFLLIRRKKLGITLGMLFGVTLMLWICIQFYMWGGQLLSVLYFIFGLLQLIVGYAASVFYKQESFCFDESKYTRIGENKDRLVVCFSRMGYTKKAAYERADEIGADIYEIKAAERTGGTIGFWWCGRFGLLRREMPIELPKKDFSRYKYITIVSPIWVFGLSAPVRAFCEMYEDRVLNAEYIFVHYTRGRYKNAADEADRLLGTRASSVTNICCRQGSFVKVITEKR